MKKTSTILAISSALIGSASADIESSFHVGYSSDYVFRGINTNDLFSVDSGLYEYGLSFAGDCNCGATWEAGIWQADIGSALEERNVFASISKDFGAVELSLGLIRYDYSGGAILNSVEDTTELALGAGTQIAGLDVAAALYYDVDANDGNLWGEISVGKSYDLGGGAALDLAAIAGTVLEDGGTGSWTTVGLSAAVSKELGDNLTGRIYVAAEETHGSAADGDDLWGGLSLSYGF